ncbi:MAG: DNA-binding protein [Bacteroidales bacterium]|jgi:hypothetical protein|nr:DNA-binding protein [Bacteroidales bacterium]
MERFDRLDRKMEKQDSEKPVFTVGGEKLLDNQDLCFMVRLLQFSLQRYRVSGLLPCKRIRQKTYYLESDVKNFIRNHLKRSNGDK